MKAKGIIICLVIIIASGVYLYSDYMSFQDKKLLAARLPPNIGAVCHDGWLSYSTGRGMCSHHGGVKFWGTELRRVAEQRWASRTLIPMLVVGAILAIPTIIFLIQQHSHKCVLSSVQPEAPP